jgi:hypothetical protein
MTSDRHGVRGYGERERDGLSSDRQLDDVVWFVRVQGADGLLRRIDRMSVHGDDNVSGGTASSGRPAASKRG